MRLSRSVHLSWILEFLFLCDDRGLTFCLLRFALFLFFLGVQSFLSTGKTAVFASPSVLNSGVFLDVMGEEIISSCPPVFRFLRSVSLSMSSGISNSFFLLDEKTVFVCPSLSCRLICIHIYLSVSDLTSFSPLWR